LLWVLVLALGGCQREHVRLVKEVESARRAELRARALSRLSELGHEEDFHLFLKAAHDPSVVVRRAAADALGKSGDAKAIDTLGELLSDIDDEVRAEAATGLARFSTEKARAYLMSSYGRQDASARAAIARALGPAGMAEAVRHEAKVLWERNVKALESGGPAERVGAAEELGRSGRGEAVERLLPLLGDDSVLLAAGAARGLGSAGDRRAVASLLGVLKENFPVLREAAADALGTLGDPAAVPSLQKMAVEGGPGAIAAVRALGQLGGAKEARAALCKVASEGGLDVAGLAARLARERDNCPAEPILARLARGGAQPLAALAALEALSTGAGAEKAAALLESPDRALRLAAARALSEMGAAAAGPRIERALLAEAEQLLAGRQRWVKLPLPLQYGKDFAPGSEEQGLEALGDPAGLQRRVAKYGDMMAKVEALNEAKAQALGVRLGDRDTTANLDLVSDGLEGQEELLSALCLAAGRLHLSGALPVLQKLSGVAPSAVKAASCEALGTLGTPESFALAHRCLLEGGRGAVGAAAHGLARAGPGAAPTLLKALEERRSERAEIIRALGELHHVPAAEAIAAVLSAGGLEAAEAAVALGRLGNPAFAGILAEQLKDPTSQARLDVIEALGALAAPASQPGLTRELCNDRPELRAAAARALGRLAPQGHLPGLEALRFDYYAEVRRAAEEALARLGERATGKP
jgi:HEAT repeat protein